MKTDRPDPEAAFQDLDVSRETLERLTEYAALLKKWNPAINLVAPSTLSDIWTRHFLDSAQIWQYLPPNAENLADLGSGAGFPGLIIASIAKEDRPDLQVTCVESDARKGAFLQTVIRELGLNARVITDRIETTPPLNSDVVTARALASLSDLLAHADRHLTPNGQAVFLKGITAQQEIKDARMKWAFDIKVHPSKTSSEGQILVLKGIERV